MIGQTQRTFRLRLERRIGARRERVFRAFTTSEDLRRWSAPVGLDVVDGSVDLRVGGRWSVVMRDATRGVDFHAAGEYREIVPPERLVFTHRWLSDPTPVETVVTVELHEDGDATRVVMTHDGFLGEDVRDGHREGWSSCLDQLERLVA